MIDCLPVSEIKPEWSTCSGDRYVSHPQLRTAMIQLLDSPEKIYVVSDQTLPRSVEEAKNLVRDWRIARDTNPE